MHPAICSRDLAFFYCELHTSHLVLMEVMVALPIIWGSLEHSNSAGIYYKPREVDPMFKNFVTAKLSNINNFSIWKGIMIFVMKLEWIKFRKCFLPFQNLVSLDILSES
jgi:hypothetical protein